MFASDAMWSAGATAANPLRIATLWSHFAVKFAPALRVTADWRNLAIRKNHRNFAKLVDLAAKSTSLLVLYVTS